MERRKAVPCGLRKESERVIRRDELGEGRGEGRGEGEEGEGRGRKERGQDKARETHDHME